MSAELRRIADDYLARLRRSMAGATPDVIEECEIEIRAHIEDALAARGAPDVSALLDVLERLGPPEVYGRDLALYMMVEAGYREWSLRHMVRSTIFWAMSTGFGAVVVVLFGLLFALAAGMVAVGGLGWAGIGTAPWVPPPVGSWRPLTTLLVGVLVMVALTATVRWFVGQYVRRARPMGIGEGPAGEDWVGRASRRILVVAVVGLAATIAAGAAAGIYRIDARLDAVGDLTRPPDYAASPLAVLSGAALIVFLLAPVLGVLWMVGVERWRQARAGLAIGVANGAASGSASEDAQGPGGDGPRAPEPELEAQDMPKTNSPGPMPRTDAQDRQPRTDAQDRQSKTDA